MVDLNKKKLKKLSQFIAEFPEHSCDSFSIYCDEKCDECPWEEYKSEEFSKFLNKFASKLT